MDLSRFSAAASARLSYLPFENDRAFPAQARVPSAPVVEAVNVFEHYHFGLATGLPVLTPDQPSFLGFMTMRTARDLSSPEIEWVTSAAYRAVSP